MISIAGDRCKFAHDNVHGDTKNDGTFKRGHCWDCGEEGHHIGDRKCLKPDAALNFPSWARRFLPQYSDDQDNDDNKRSNGKRKRTARSAEEILNSAENDIDDKDSKNERRMALLESNMRVLINRTAPRTDNDTPWYGELPV